MKVKELIEVLKGMPQDAEVGVAAYSEYRQLVASDVAFEPGIPFELANGDMSDEVDPDNKVYDEVVVFKTWD